MDSEPGPPSRLRRLLTHRSSRIAALALPAAAVAAAVGVAATAFGAGGVATVCIPDYVANDGGGGFNDPVAGPGTRTVQRTTGPTRRVILWQGAPLRCPARNVTPCALTYVKPGPASYSNVVNLVGGFGPTRGRYTVPFPIVTPAGEVRNTTHTLTWTQPDTVHVRPGRTATPTLAVDYQEWRGDLVGAYHYWAEHRNCHAYHLSPDETFGNWRGEVATKPLATFVIG